jgi:hypothetical protein
MLEAPNASPSTVRTSPYPGLAPFQITDTNYFFGRSRDRAVVADTLVASRITILYGPSGVGKSSLLRAGVTADLARLAEQNRLRFHSPELAVVVFHSWEADIAPEFASAIERGVERTLAPERPRNPPGNARLYETLKWAHESVDGPIFVIFDQFEDYFEARRRGARAGTFASEFVRTALDRRLRIHFIIGIREDAFASLDYSARQIPGFFDNSLRLEYLTHGDGVQAIQEPIGEWQRRTGEAVVAEPALVERVLADVGTHSANAPADGTAPLGLLQDLFDLRIETPFLQIVMNRLWTEDGAATAGSSRILQLETYERLG